MSWVTISELAKIKGVTRQAVRKWLEDGKYNYKKKGRKILVEVTKSEMTVAEQLRENYPEGDRQLTLAELRAKLATEDITAAQVQQLKTINTTIMEFQGQDVEGIKKAREQLEEAAQALAEEKLKWAKSLASQRQELGEKAEAMTIQQRTLQDRVTTVTEWLDHALVVVEELIKLFDEIADGAKYNPTHPEKYLMPRDVREKREMIIELVESLPELEVEDVSSILVESELGPEFED